MLETASYFFILDAVLNKLGGNNNWSTEQV